MDMSDEGIELRSPFPVVPPVKDSKWGDLPNSADGESRPVEPPVLYPEIGESHPCPFFKGPELNFIHPRERKVKKSPVKVPAPLPVPVPIAVPQIPSDSTDGETIFYEFLDECLHGAIWEYISQHAKDLSREMYCALISSNPGKYVLDNETTEVLRKKLLKKNNDPNWTEICNPVDNISVDVLTCHAYKLTKARYTLTNKILTEFHKDVVINSVSQKLLDIYSNDMEKKLKKQDYKELKQNPPRIGF